MTNARFFPHRAIILAFATVLLLFGCGGVKSLRQAFKGSPYEKYVESLRVAKLENTALGQDWLRAGQKALSDSLVIKLPFKETGYFSAEKPSAVAYHFPMKRGEKLSITLETQSKQPIQLFVDVFERSESNKAIQFKRVAYADTTRQPFTFEPKRDATYLVRMQPELLRSGQYTITIQNGPSLAFPVQGKGNSAVGSFFGVDRDAGRRSHEGVDIFAPKGTPVLAATEGYIRAVNQNRLGGKVVWQEDPERNFTLYYAHLDSQLVQPGKDVKIGDTLGLVGNTGNARTTPAHLHFGIYTGRGAIDPFPFIRESTTPAKVVTADMTRLGSWLRTSTAKALLRTSPDTKTPLFTSLTKHTLVKIEAGTVDWYRVSLPDGTPGFIASKELEPITKSVKEISIQVPTPLWDAPDSSAASKVPLSPGTAASVLATFGPFQYVHTPSGLNGWITE